METRWRWAEGMQAAELSTYSPTYRPTDLPTYLPTYLPTHLPCLPAHILMVCRWAEGVQAAELEAGRALAQAEGERKATIEELTRVRTELHQLQAAHAHELTEARVRTPHRRQILPSDRALSPDPNLPPDRSYPPD